MGINIKGQFTFTSCFYKNKSSENSQFTGCFTIPSEFLLRVSDISPTGPTLKGSSMLTRQLQESWRNLRTRYVLEKLIFEVTDASVVQEANSKYVVSDNITYIT